ncbi:MAG: ribonuclease P protein component [Bacteroidales bacterium]|nr:ribonuclease P protein component [Bacteroidales bacterium]
MSTDLSTEKQSCQFPKAERLHGHNAIANLFSNGKSFYQHPFKVVVFEAVADENPPLRMLISVSKRNFKKAVDRNRTKRLCREAWRLQKSALNQHLASQNIRLDVALIYTAGRILPFADISRKIKVILQRLKEEHEVHS